MMVKTILMLVVVMLWTGSLTLVSSSPVVECTGEPVINSDDTITQGQIGDVVSFNCDASYILNGNTGSKTCGADGQWKINGCEDCYSYTQNKLIQTGAVKRFNTENQTECDEACTTNPLCASALVIKGICRQYPEPRIFAAGDTSYDQCKLQCTQMTECLMFNHVGQRQRCFIYTQTLQNLLDAGLTYYPWGTAADKLC